MFGLFRVLTSVIDKLKRSVHIISRVKSENEKGYYIVDAINEAINVGVKISFYYSELNGKKKEVLRNDVKLYTVSPFDLIWDGDYYYLTGYCDEREFVRTYRVDQIKKQLELLTEKAVKKPKGYNVSKYTAEVSRMFSTDEAVDVTLLCDNCCMNDVVGMKGLLQNRVIILNCSPSSRQLKKYKFFLPVEIYLLAVFMQLASKFRVFPLALKFRDSFASVYCCSNLYNLRSFLREYLYQ